MEAREGLGQALRRVGNSVRYVANGDTEDVVQEAVARALKSGVSLEAEAWLRTVAKRVAIDKHRRSHETPSGAPTELEKWAAPSEPDPEDAFIRGERQRAVREALAQLPPRYQRALLAYAEEDSPSDVATRLGLSAAATWTLLSRARSRLKLQLEQAGFVPAMFMGGNRPRLRTLLAAGAVAATATSAVLIPNANLTPVDKPSVPKVTSVSAPAARKPAPKPASAVDAELPVDSKAVAGKVDEVVAQAPDVGSSVALKSCIGPDDREIGLEVEVEERESLLSKIVEAVPEPLRDPLAMTCASK